MAGEAVQVSAIVTFLSTRLGRPIEDKTGLTGRYSWELKWAPDENEFRPDSAPVPRSTPDACGPGPRTVSELRRAPRLRFAAACYARSMADNSVTSSASATYPQLLSLAVHEFRTPASVVSGYLRMLQRDGDPARGAGPEPV